MLRTRTSRALFSRFRALPRLSTRHNHSSAPPPPPQESTTQPAVPEEPSFEISAEEAKFSTAIADMKHVQGHIVKQAGGKYTIEYPQLTEKQNELNAYLRSQANERLKELDERMSRFDGEEARASGVLGWTRYWVYSAEFVACLFAAIGVSYLMSGFRYWLDGYYLQMEVQQQEQEFQSRVWELEEEIVHLNRQNYVNKS